MKEAKKWRCLGCHNEVEVDTGTPNSQRYHFTGANETLRECGLIVPQEFWMKYSELQFSADDMEEALEDIIEHTKVYAGGNSRFSPCGEDASLNWIHDRAEAGMSRIRRSRRISNRGKDDGSTTEQD